MAIVLVAGTISTIVPSTTAFAQLEYKGYEDSYGKDHDKKKSAGINAQKIKCINSNVNVNGIDVNQKYDPNSLEAQGLEGGEGEENVAANAMNNNEQGNGINLEKNLANFCINVNANEQVAEEEPQTGSLTVKKEILGCLDNNPDDGIMNCQGLDPSPENWLSCDDPNISNTVACLNLQENFFDIEVLDEQNNQISEFTGSQQGETITNLEPGTQYTVNEIRQPIFVNDQLFEFEGIQLACNGNGFPEGGNYINSDADINYNICFEYEDEQGEDCSTTTIAAGEDKTCTVKNYIFFDGAGG